MNDAVKYVREYGMNKVLFDNKKRSIDSDIMRMRYSEDEPIDITSAVRRAFSGNLTRYEWIITQDKINVIGFTSGSIIKFYNTLLEINKDGIIFKADIIQSILDEIIYTIDTFDTTINGKRLRDFLDLYNVWDSEYIDKKGDKYDWNDL